MFRKLKVKKSCGGFVFVELAISLPLIILLMYGLASVSLKIFELSKNQLADYVLEEEAHYLLERITHQARAAKSVNATNSLNTVEFFFHTSAEDTLLHEELTIDDVCETQWYMPHKKKGSQAVTVNAKRQDDDSRLNPITGDNSFGETTLVKLKFSELRNASGEDTNVLHITLEMKSLVTNRKLKLSTAVFMPACESKSGLPHE
ncbi:MAG: hypothetical protein IJ685_07855 [Selenomonadaceae bacterium]|nr:hypothetical protein [Selenomonadaceae bacterium]